MCEVGLPRALGWPTSPRLIRLRLNGPLSSGQWLTLENARLNENTTTPTRKGSTPIKVWVLPEEKRAIDVAARQCGMSTSAYLRAIGLSLPVKSVLDQEAVADLVKVNADQGRLGGLLKLWLTNDEKLRNQRWILEQHIHGLLKEIQAAQALLLETVRRI
jgi:hypothetical protein